MVVKKLSRQAGSQAEVSAGVEVVMVWLIGSVVAQGTGRREYEFRPAAH